MCIHCTMYMYICCCCLAVGEVPYSVPTRYEQEEEEVD